MSSKIVTQFAVRDMKVMEDTLKKLGFSYSKKDGRLEIKRQWNNIAITENNVTCDSAHSHEVESIRFEYGKAMAMAHVEQTGELYQVEENANELTILVN